MNTQATSTLVSHSSVTKSEVTTCGPIAPFITKAEINALHNKFQTYGQNAKHWLRQCQMLLPRIRDEEVWKKKGFSSIYEYAAKLAGMSHNSVNEALRVYDALQDKPILKGEVGKHGTHKVKTILTVATQDTQEFWLERLNEMSKSTLETYVREYKHSERSEAEGVPSSTPKIGSAKHNIENGLPGEGQRTPDQDCDMSNGGIGDEAGDGTVRNKQMSSMYMKLDVKTIERMKKLKGDMNWDEMLNEMLNVYEESVETGEKPAPVNTGKRYVPKEIEKYVTKQTSGLCAYPDCTKPYEILHHTERFALDQTHDPDTLRPLCKAHERLAHKGLIEGEEKSPVEFVGGGGEGELSADKAEIKVNWSLRTDPDMSSPKHAIDEKVNEYYMPKME